MSVHRASPRLAARNRSPRPAALSVTVAVAGALAAPAIANADVTVTAPPAAATVTVPLPPASATVTGAVGGAQGAGSFSLPGGAAATLPGVSQPLVDQLQRSLQQLIGLPAGSPTPQAVTGPLARIIDQLAGIQGLPPEVRLALTQISDALRNGGPPSLAQLGGLFQQLSTSPQVPAQAASAFSALASAFGAPGSAGTGGAGGSNGSGGGSGSAGAAGLAGFNGSNPFGAGFNSLSAIASGRMDSPQARAYGGIIKSVSYNRKRRAVSVVIYCSAARTSCNTAVAVYKGRAQAAKPIAKTIGAQKTATMVLGLSKASASAVAKRKVKTLQVVAVSNTPYGRTHSAKALSLGHASKHAGNRRGRRHH